jgi:hypothetical protein
MGICDSAEEAAEMAFQIKRKRDERKFAAAAARGPGAVLGLR